MNENNEIYMDERDRIPTEDRKRLEQRLADAEGDERDRLIVEMERVSREYESKARMTREGRIGELHQDGEQLTKSDDPFEF